MISNIKIAISVLDCDLTSFKEEIYKINESKADYIHIDVMDGHFVPNLSFGSPLIKNLKKHTNLFIDTHLMVNNSEKFIDQFISNSDMITIHFESTTHLDSVINRIKNAGLKVGVAIVPTSPISLLENVLPLIDQVLIMTVNPGFGNQTLIPYCVNKVEKLSQIRLEMGLNFDISCDGGVNHTNSQLLIEKGVNTLVCGSGFWKAENKIEYVNRLKGFFTV